MGQQILVPPGRNLCPTSLLTLRSKTLGSCHMHWVGELRVIGRLKGYLIDQEVYLSEMLQSFGLTDCKSTDTPKQPGLAVEEHWRANSKALSGSGWETDVCNVLHLL
jgi:hypothetical protein